MIIYSGTQCAKVSGGAVTATGRFAALIAPTSPLSGGISEADAKTRFGVYPQQRHASTATHKVVDATPWYDSEADAVYSTTLEVSTLAERKAEKTAAITARRWEVETGGITLNGAAIATDTTSQAKLSGALQLVQRDDTRIIDWKGVNGWIILDAADVTAIAVSVGGHVQACFTREKEMLAAVTAAETTSALALVDPQAGTIDGAGGWPT